ncbi:hypothetical protein [Salegentibacter salarius]|uniref:Uncharacterized protein n=1 Tax=Salegentibacter salarius TaxID=435906 RepID=A0A2N0U5B0_9FLAO|nr:hypothetical protein [Salegentibacter salarius]OEY73991.1 hypothetical protein BHS39_00770 [Salegentibacter salarius]PKD22191.1 hypothetical protein APR40_00770 [Salegentibacter salarius]SLJ86238.1 hypothetical protein SAMN05660445_00098 [Salegentibacter salarius]
MKIFKNYFMGVAIVAMLFASCSKDENAGEPKVGDEMATISLGAVLNDFIRNQDVSKQSIPECSDDAPMYARVVLTHELGEEDVVVPINFDGTTYFTDYDEDLAIPIPAGETTTAVSLTDFWVYSEEPGDTTLPIWVAPKEGSDYENFVNDPLPINFDLRAGSKKYVDVEVLCFDDRDVNLYGYQFFDLVPIPLIKFCLFGNFCPSEDGRHYVAGYTVNVWMGSEAVGDPIYTESNTVEEDETTGDYYSDPLCFWLPDTAETDTYYFQITLNNTDEYSSDDAGEVILAGAITDDEIKMFYSEDDDSTMDYYHFNYGCGNDNPPPFDDPRTEAKRYKACLKNLGDSNAVGFAYLKLQGNQLTATTAATELTPGDVPQHIHENATCADYGSPIWDLDYTGDVWPEADAAGNLFYTRTFTLTPAQVAAANLDLRTAVLHEADMTPLACGEFEEY